MRLLSVLHKLWSAGVFFAFGCLAVFCRAQSSSPVIVTNPVSQLVQLGGTADFSVSATGDAPLNYQWRKESVELPGATDSVLTIPNAQVTDAGYYDVVITNDSGSATSTVAALTVNTAVPDSFNPISDPVADSIGGPFVIQPDGKLLIAGSFDTPNNPYSRVARFFPDGSVDPSFNSPTNISFVYCLGLQEDGRVFGSGATNQVPTYWRLTSDGLFDSTFTPAASVQVLGIAMDPSGSAWIGGNFTYSKPSILTNLARLLPDGTVDTNVQVGANFTIKAVAEQPDGKLLVGGFFTSINGHPANYLARLNTNGVLDSTFSASADSLVFSIVVQPDGKLLVSGAFTNLNGTNINRLARLNADGSLDSSFNPNVDGPVYSLALQADGQVIVGGSFYSVSGQSRNYLARVKPNGTLDLTFNPNVNPVTDGAVYSIGLQTNGTLVISGIFSQVGDQFRTNIARLQPLGPVSSSLNYDGTNLTWLRSGATPEVWRTKFESSSDGITWTSLGAGERINGGWQLANVTLPAGARVRARGFTTGGKYNGSPSLVEESTVIAAAPPPFIVTNDSSFGVQTNTFAFTVRAVAGQTIITEASVDLATWVPLQTNVVDNSGQFLFSDVLPDVSQRFYRVRQTPQ